MANNELLSKYNQPDIGEFSDDMIEIARVASELDRYYGKSEYEIEGYLEEFNGILISFSRKYKGIVLKLVQKIESLELKIFLREKYVKDFFANSASKLKGIISIGLEDFGEVDVSNTEKFSKVIDNIKDALYISYSEIESGTSNVAVKSSKGMVEIITNSKELRNKNSADFRIISFYALRDGVKRSISIHSKLMSFGFFNVMNEIERREWFEKFSPRFLE